VGYGHCDQEGIPIEGFIKLHRSSLDSAVFQSPHSWKVWCWLLLNANWSHRQLKNGKVLEPGQLVISYDRMSRDLKCSKSTIFRVLRAMQTRCELVLKPEPSGTVVTICQWSTYQDRKPEVETIAERSRNDSGTIAETEEEGKKRKKGRNNKGVFSFDEMKLAFPTMLDNDQARSAMAKWVEYQESRGTPFPTRQGAQILLERYAKTGSAALVRDVDHCIAMNWAGLYPAKDTGGNGQAERIKKDPAEQWQRIIYRVMKCKGHEILDEVCTSCGVPAKYIDRATSELKRNGVMK